MTSCTHCGTQNRDGSKFCGNCGARMAPQSGLICPMCGTANKLESVFCANCGARLAPLIAKPTVGKSAPPIKGLSLPAKPYDPSTDVVEEPKPDEPADAAEDWLTPLREPPPDQTPAVVAEEDVPAWLRPAAPTAETILPATPDEQPSWLRAFQPATDPVAESTPEISGDEIPDWLKPPGAEIVEPITDEPALPAPAAAEPAAEIEPLTPATPDELPAWVKELAPAMTLPAASVPPSQPVAEIQATPGEPLIEALEEKTAGVWKMSAPLTAIEGVEEIPDWLRTATPVEPDPALQATLAELQPAMLEQMPDWIAALKPAEQFAPAAEEPLESVGPLAGLRGVLPLAIAVAEPHITVKPAGAEIVKPSAAIFETLLAAPSADTSKPTRRALTMRPLIYLLLALAVLIPFFLPSDWASSALELNGTPASEFYDLVQTVPANSTVLLAFEYDPSTAGEMNLQATAVARHLIQRNIKIVTLSTFETGAPIARKIVDAAARGKNYSAGVNYAHVGYLAGHDAGLSNLAAVGLPAPTLGVKTLRDLQLVIVFAGTDDALKTWMEQVQPRGGVKIAAGVSAAVEPRARAYRDTPTRQLTALTSGLVGAAQYEVLSNPRDTGLALVSINAQTAAQLVLVLIIVIGNLAQWFARPQRQNG